MDAAEAFRTIVRLGLSVDAYSGWVHQYGNHFTCVPRTMTPEEGVLAAVEMIVAKIEPAVIGDAHRPA